MPDDQRGIQEPTRFQVQEQASNRFVHGGRPLTMVLLDVRVSVPGIIPRITAAEELHEAHSLFHQSPSEQTIAPKMFADRIVHAIELSGGFRFFGEIHDFGRLALHPEGQFVGRDAGGKFRLSGVLLGVKLIQGLDEVKTAALMFGLDIFRRGQVHDRISVIAEGCSLIDTRQEPGAPVLGPPERSSHAVQQNDESGQVLVLTSQTVDRPGTHAGSSGLNESCHHLEDRRRVVVAKRLDGSDNCDVVNAFRRVSEEFRDFDPGLAIFLEREGAH